MTFSKFSSSDVHSVQLWYNSPYNGSSQLISSLHILCSICFPRNVYGAISPSESYIDATVDSIPLLVNGFSLSLNLYWKVSVSVRHYSPSTLSKLSTLKYSSCALASCLSVLGMDFITAVAGEFM